MAWTLFQDYQFVNSAYRDDAGFLALLLRQPRGRVHPVKHLTMISFLFDTWTDFLMTYQSMCTQPGPIKNTATSKPGNDVASRKKEFLALLGTQCVSVSGAARCLQISVGTAIRWAQQHHIQYKKRPKVMQPEVETKLSILLRKGMHRDDAAKQANVSRQSVDRFLHSQPSLMDEWKANYTFQRKAEYRARFLQTVSDHPGYSIKAIRSIPANGFQWLYRHDRSWLSAHLPSLLNIDI
jgi:hypothetical protein